MRNKVKKTQRYLKIQQSNANQSRASVDMSRNEGSYEEGSIILEKKCSEQLVTPPPGKNIAHYYQNLKKIKLVKLINQDNSSHSNSKDVLKS